MLNSTIDGGGSWYDHQSKIQLKKNYRKTWQQSESPVPHFKKMIGRLLDINRGYLDCVTLTSPTYTI
jgi:hypothetical protein